MSPGEENSSSIATSQGNALDAGSARKQTREKPSGTRYAITIVLLLFLAQWSLEVYHFRRGGLGRQLNVKILDHRNAPAHYVRGIIGRSAITGKQVPLQPKSSGIYGIEWILVDRLSVELVGVRGEVRAEVSLGEGTESDVSKDTTLCCRSLSDDTASADAGSVIVDLDVPPFRSRWATLLTPPAINARSDLEILAATLPYSKFPWYPALLLLLAASVFDLFRGKSTEQSGNCDWGIGNCGKLGEWLTRKSLVVSLVLLLGLWCAFPSQAVFDTNDDFQILAIVKGGFEIPASANSIYVSPILGALLSGLYRFSDIIPWYSALLCTSVFLGYICFSLSVLATVGWAPRGIFLIFILSLLVRSFSLVTSFTGVAGLCAAFAWGILLSHVTMGEVDKSQPSLHRVRGPCAACLLLLAFLLRVPPAGVVSLCGAVLLCVLVISRSYRARLPLLPLGVAVLSALWPAFLGAFAATLIHTAVWQSSSEMRTIGKTVDLAGRIDYSTAAGVQWRSFSSKLGVRPEILTMINHHFFSDPGFRDLETYKRYVVALEDPDYGTSGAESVTISMCTAKRLSRSLLRIVTTDRVKGLFVVLLSGVFWSFFWLRRGEFGGVVLSCLLPLAILPIVDVCVKPVPLRVSYGPLLLSSLVIGASGFSRKQTRFATLQGIALLGWLCLGLHMECERCAERNRAVSEEYLSESHEVASLVRNLDCPLLVSHLPSSSIPVHDTECSLMACRGIPFYFAAHLPAAAAARQHLGFTSSFEWLRAGRRIALLTPRNDSALVKDFIAYWECHLQGRVEIETLHAGEIWKLQVAQY